MKITALMENTLPEAEVKQELFVEHGLSLYIETDSCKILFDMGQSDLFARNAEIMGIDLAQVDLAVLSHGHYDHGGGLAKFLEINQKAPVYVSPHAFEPHYHGEKRYIGLDTALIEKREANAGNSTVSVANDRLIYTEDKTVIGEGLCLYSCNQKEKKFELGTFGLNMVQDGVIVPEDFRHEQYLLIEENGKRVLISGCSHKGIMDIVSWFEPDVLVGGFHFSKLPLDETLAEYAWILNCHKIQYYTCHCTGTEQFGFMKQHMDHLEYLACGQKVVI